MAGSGDSTLDGGCACGFVRYRLTSAPMFVHCCHCMPAFRVYYPSVELAPAASMERRARALA